jgi:hypothetical protein
MKTTMLAIVTAAAALTVAPLLAGTAQADPTRLAQVDINIGGSRPGVVEHRRRPGVVIEERRRPDVVVRERRRPNVVIEERRRPGVMIETEGRGSYR